MGRDIDNHSQPESEAAETRLDDAAPSPLKLRIAAHLFIIEGVVALASQLGDLFWVGGCSLDVGVLGIFIGRGLLRHRNGWRTAGLFFAHFILLFVVMGLMLLVLLPWLNPDGEFSYGPGGPIGAVATILIVTAVAFLQVRVLRSPGITELFRTACERETPDVPWIPRKFSIAMVLYATLLAAVAFASIRSTRSDIEHQREHDASTLQRLP